MEMRVQDYQIEMTILSCIAQCLRLLLLLSSNEIIHVNFQGVGVSLLSFEFAFSNWLAMYHCANVS